jgi:hypothetical protein
LVPQSQFGPYGEEKILAPAENRTPAVHVHKQSVWYKLE